MAFPDQPLSGNITTQNLNPATGVPTAASTVEIDNLEGVGSVVIQVTGVYTGALTPQISIDGTNWISVGANSIINLNSSAYSQTIPSAGVGIYQIGVSGMSKFRLSANAAVTGTAVVSVRTTDAESMLAIDNALPPGANTIGAVTMTGTTVTSNTPVAATSQNLTAAATTNATSVKATAASLFQIALTNYSAAAKFFKVYNKASAPTVGTDIPVATFEVAANSSRVLEFGALGMRLATGYAFAMTGLQADSDTTALAAGDLKVKSDYI